VTRRALTAAVLAALAAGGCDSGQKAEPRAEKTPPARTPTAPPEPAPDRSDRETIDGWARTLARSDEDGAARYFATPLLVSQGPTQQLTTRAAVRAFNASLPCGARLLATRRERGYVVATFRLKNRPGHRCDSPGAKAAVAFRFRDGRISEWRRVPVPGEDSAPPAETETT
jgi:hypothetical protein